MTWSEISFSLRNLPVRAFDSRAQGFSPPLARQRSSCPPPSPNLVRTHLIENHQALRDSAPCLSRAATLPKVTKLELGRGAHLKTPSSANHTAAASQPTGRIAKAASWLHLSRVSPALLPPERPSHTHTPKPGFGGRGHDGRVGSIGDVRTHLDLLSILQSGGKMSKRLSGIIGCKDKTSSWHSNGFLDDSNIGSTV